MATSVSLMNCYPGELAPEMRSGCLTLWDTTERSPRELRRRRKTFCKQENGRRRLFWGILDVCAVSLVYFI